MDNNINHKEILGQLFENTFNESVKTINKLPPSGSDRIYYHITSENEEAIGAYNPDIAENRTFFYFTEIFTKHNLNVPTLINKGDNKGHYLVSFLPGKSLLDIVKEEGYTNEVKELYKKAVAQLIRFQWDVGQDIDYEMCYDAQSFDRAQILADLMYFKYYFLDLQKIKYNKLLLMNELQEWSKELAGAMPKSFMYRDFQSRNILVDQDLNLGFIDYQGGMQGVPQYDLASLLWQAKAALPMEWKNELFRYYLDLLTERKVLVSINESAFIKGYQDSVLLRILQTLGAYGFRGMIEGKLHFIESIVPALTQLKGYLDENPRSPGMQELRKVLEEITKQDFIEKIEKSIKTNDGSQSKLNISIYSFAYKNGQPKNLEGNGGGYVFDCRGILNPGREEKYKSLTGKDKSVKDYLESNTEMTQYLKKIYDVVDVSIQNYIERDFDALSIAFGCTGGQHRSVYAAEQMADHLRSKYGLKNISITHLEQDENKLERMK